jgi:hypothetical protein
MGLRGCLGNMDALRPNPPRAGLALTDNLSSEV